MFAAPPVPPPAAHPTETPDARPTPSRVRGSRAVVAVLPPAVYTVAATLADASGLSVGQVVAATVARALGLSTPSPAAAPASGVDAPPAQTTETLPPDFWRKAFRAAGFIPPERARLAYGRVPTPQEVLALRTRAQLSQRAAAELCHVSRSNLSEMEAGRRTNADSLRHVANTLEAHIEARLEAGR